MKANFLFNLSLNSKDYVYRTQLRNSPPYITWKKKKNTKNIVRVT